ncbi:hypothetical protein [Streptomyces sp. NPDC006610]
MYGTEEEDGRGSGEVREAAGRFLRGVPPLMLAGVDEDDTWEPHLVRGID